jgi:hypothetical protein
LDRRLTVPIHHAQQAFGRQEDDMNDRHFSAPVEIELDPGHRRSIASVWEGIEFLSEIQPIKPGPRYRAALRACRDALDGWQSTVEARRAFVAAAREAHVLGKH